MPDNKGLNILPQFNGNLAIDPINSDNPLNQVMGPPSLTIQSPGYSPTMHPAFPLNPAPFGGYPKPGDYPPLGSSTDGSGPRPHPLNWINVNSGNRGGYPQSVGSTYNVNRSPFMPSYQQLLFPGSLIGPTGSTVNPNQTPTPLTRDSHPQGLNGVAGVAFNTVRSRNII